MKVRDGYGLGGQVCVVVDLALLAGQTAVGPGGDVVGKSMPHKPGRNNTTGGKPPGVSNIRKITENVFSEF